MTENLILKWIQRGIILFWACWFSLATASDFTNLLQILKILPTDFNFNSKNYNLIVQYLRVYHLDLQNLALILFIIITFSVFVIALSFWVALLTFSFKKIYFAFAISIAFTFIFIMADEIFIQYEIEHSHLIRVILQICTLMLFYLLAYNPHKERAN